MGPRRPPAPHRGGAACPGAETGCRRASNSLPCQPTPATLTIARGPRRKRDRLMRMRNWALSHAPGTRSEAAAWLLAAALLVEVCQLGNAGSRTALSRDGLLSR